jgi:hypothetical protein
MSSHVDAVLQTYRAVMAGAVPAAAMPHPKSAA